MTCVSESGFHSRCRLKPTFRVRVSEALSAWSNEVLSPARMFCRSVLARASLSEPENRTLPPTVRSFIRRLLKFVPTLPDDVMPFPAPKPPNRCRPPPGPPPKAAAAKSVKPILFVLLIPPMSENWSSSTNRFSIVFTSYRPRLPAPAKALPNHPCFMPGFTVRLITASASPSSKPVSMARSLFFS